MLEDMAERFPGVKIVIDHAGKADLKAANCWEEFRKHFKLKRFPQVWISNSEPYEMSEIKEYPYEDTLPFYKTIYVLNSLFEAQVIQVGITNGKGTRVCRKIFLLLHGR
tara:strand:+ start:10321 stop:10647 length:327 start_codon:yes stop_codon:yes gene_type:complete